MLQKIVEVREPQTARFVFETKCKRGGCKKICRVTYDGGKISVALP
jgi:hypothetical protein